MKDNETKSALDIAKEEARAKRDEGRKIVEDAAKAAFPVGSAVTYAETVRHTTEVVGYEGTKIVLSNGTKVPFNVLKAAS